MTELSRDCTFAEVSGRPRAQRDVCRVAGPRGGSGACRAFTGRSGVMREASQRGGLAFSAGLKQAAARRGMISLQLESHPYSCCMATAGLVLLLCPCRFCGAVRGLVLIRCF